MPSSRRILCVPIVVALLAAVGLSGCGGSGEEQSLASAVAKSGVLGGLTDELKREDDESEARELQEHAPLTREEREEAHEQAEAAAIAAAQGQEGEAG
jgi:hypothetical protein